MSNAAPSDVYRFGPGLRHVLDTRARTLRLDGQPLPLGARAFDLLLTLVAAQGELRTKEQLLTHGWPGLVVEEANVHVQVSQLRKLLGADAIATVQGLGYRMGWPVARGDADVRRHNLPAARTGFVGRKGMLTELALQLGESRLITLIGIGGAGKTRLSLRLAEQQLPRHADGVWWVDLAALDQADQVAAHVVHALGLAPPLGGRAIDALLDWLRPRELLLVLDNCEHLIDPVAELADMCLAEAAGLRVMATSREALGLPGERVYPVRPLSLPSPQDDVDTILGTESVQLFLDRASSASSGAVSADDLSAVAEICRRVDGIPLALELAAAQLRVLTASQLLELLQDRLRLLAGQRRAVSRQHTMRAVLQWSYEHLHDDEKQILMALAVCSGGCDIDAAAALMDVAVASPVLLAGLSRLAEQSLLSVQRGPGKARYMLLETVRQFALEQLQGTSHAAALRDRHAAHYLAVAEAFDAAIRQRADSDASLRRLDLERENLLHAIDACADDPSELAAERGLRLVAALRHYWINRGLTALGLKMALRALERAGRRTVDAHHLFALSSAVWMHNASGQLEEGLALARQFAALATAAGEPAHALEAHRGMGISLRGLGRYDEAAQEHRLALALARQLGDAKLIGDALQSLCVTNLWAQRMAVAMVQADEVLAIRRQHPHGELRLEEALQNAGRAACAVGDLPRARSLFIEALDVLPSVGSATLEVHLVDHVARLAAAGGQWQEAVVLHSASWVMARNAGLALEQGRDAQWQSVLPAARQALGDAAFENAWTEGQGATACRALARARAWLHADPA